MGTGSSLARRCSLFRRGYHDAPPTSATPFATLLNRQAAAPPSTLSTAPVMNEASSLNRKATARACSSGWAILPSGRLEYVLSALLEVSVIGPASSELSIGVSVGPLTIH